MILDTRQLEYIIQISEEHSITKAAEKLLSRSLP